jgi:hypothetical protein
MNAGVDFEAGSGSQDHVAVRARIHLLLAVEIVDVSLQSSLEDKRSPTVFALEVFHANVSLEMLEDQQLRFHGVSASIALVKQVFLDVIPQLVFLPRGFGCGSSVDFATIAARVRGRFFLDLFWLLVGVDFLLVNHERCLLFGDKS